MGLIEAARGQNLDAYMADIAELSPGGASKDDDFALPDDAEPNFALRRHAYLDAYRTAMECHAGEPQNPEVPLSLALAAAMRSRDPEAIRDVAAKTDLLAGSGALTAVQKRSAQAAMAADGNVADAVAGLQEVHAELVRLGQVYRAAVFAIDAAVLLPDQRALRELAEAGRPLLEELGAVADLADLDAALASAPSVSGRSARCGHRSSTTTAMTRLVRSAYSA